MTDYDRVKSQYRSLHRSNAFKQGAWSVYEAPKGASILEQGDPSSKGLNALLRGVERLSENRTLAIMQELAMEAV